MVSLEDQQSIPGKSNMLPLDGRVLVHGNVSTIENGVAKLLSRASGYEWCCWRKS